jgi:hypothetical protein
MLEPAEARHLPGGTAADELADQLAALAEIVRHLTCRRRAASRMPEKAPRPATWRRQPGAACPGKQSEDHQDARRAGVSLCPARWPAASAAGNPRRQNPAGSVAGAASRVDSRWLRMARTIRM